jgi:hypothetical protein
METKILIGLVLAVVFLIVLLFALVSLSKATASDAIKNLFAKLIPKINYFLIVNYLR